MSEQFTVMPRGENPEFSEGTLMFSEGILLFSEGILLFSEGILLFSERILRLLTAIIEKSVSQHDFSIYIIIRFLPAFRFLPCMVVFPSLMRPQKSPHRTGPNAFLPLCGNPLCRHFPNYPQYKR